MKKIILNTQMIQALLAGQKTVIRQVIKDIPNNDYEYLANIAYREFKFAIVRQEMCGESYSDVAWVKAPYQVGDTLYVKEAWAYDKHIWLYKADFTPDDLLKLKSVVKWRYPYHMPKRAARIFLRVTDMRVERLQDVDGEGANPWGWVSEFEQIEKSEMKQ